jgi:16S rRNA (uracil1498-N3)-methyltransferase
MGIACLSEDFTRTMTRFFVDPSSISGVEVEFNSRDSHHLAVVLKHKSGESVLVCDGKGNEYLVVLSNVSKTASTGRITDMYRLATEPRTKVTVAQALPKTLDKLEWVFQHGTELGAFSFVPFHSARSREDWQRLKHKKDRWQEIVRSAAEQSRRAYCPIVQPICSFSEVLLSGAEYDLTLFAYEKETEKRLKDIMGDCDFSAILVIVGPEGGFTDEEAKRAEQHGAISVTLGPRILRTETAALCLLSQIYFAGD